LCLEKLKNFSLSGENEALIRRKPTNE
jgi:hypothetical protein